MTTTTWYMSFTLTEKQDFEPPPNYPKIIYLAFIANSSTGAISKWYNIKPDFTIDLGSEVQLDSYNRPGSIDLLQNPIRFIYTDLPGLNSYTIKGLETFVYGGDCILYMSADQNQDSMTYIYNNIYYLGTYQFQTAPFCFSEGTKILCYTQLENSLICILKEEYRLVQNLKIGDLVKSYLHGYRKVSKIIKGKFVNNPKDEGVANCMYRMKKTKDNGLIEDLTLTRNHGILVEKLTENEEKKIDKNTLPIIDNLLSIITADCDKFEKVVDTNTYKYYHFSLDGDGDNDRRFGVYANGILVEVPSNNMMDGVLNIKPLDF
jgi:hypothetical protein